MTKDNEDVEVTFKNVVDKEDLDFKVVEELDYTLDLGKEVIKQEGVRGVASVTYKVRYENGKEVSRAEVSREVTVNPVDQIVRVGMKDVPEQGTVVKTEVTEEIIAYNTVRKSDPTLPEGQTKVKQKGVNGKQEVVTQVTYVNGKVTESKEMLRVTQVQPIDEIILTGTKKEVDEVQTVVKTVVTEEILAYGTVRKEDSTLWAGQTKVQQEGVNGKQEVVTQVTYTNGKVTGSREVSRVTKVQPVHEVIITGTKKEVDVVQMEDEVLRLVNIERAKIGVAPLKMDVTLARLAREHSNMMSVANILVHSDLASSLRNNGIGYRIAGENIARGYHNPEQL